MIDPNQLLLGSYVEFKGTIMTVTSISRTEIGVRKGKLSRFLEVDQVNPIPLTHRWLANLGFKRIGPKYDWVLKSFFVHQRRRGWVTRKSNTILEHVHVLQNIFNLTKGSSLKLDNEQNELSK